MPSVTWQLSAPTRLSTGLIAKGTTDERRSLVSLSSISLAGAGRPYQGRPVLRPGDITDVFTIQVVKDQMRSRATWSGRSSNTRLWFFRPPPTNASVCARVSVTSPSSFDFGTKTPDAVLRHRVSDSRRFVAKCHMHKGCAGMVFAG